MGLTTLFNNTEFAVGWLTNTLASAPILNESQFTILVVEPAGCVMVRTGLLGSDVLGLRVMFLAPYTLGLTVAILGSAFVGMGGTTGLGGGACARTSAVGKHAAAKATKISLARI
jgi:hypothetical protein